MVIILWWSLGRTSQIINFASKKKVRIQIQQCKQKKISIFGTAAGDVASVPNILTHFHVAFCSMLAQSTHSNWRERSEIRDYTSTEWNEKTSKNEWKMRLALAQTSLNLPTISFFCMGWQHELAASCQKNCYISCLFFLRNSFSIVSSIRFLLLLSEIYSTELNSSSRQQQRRSPTTFHFQQTECAVCYTMASLPPSSIVMGRRRKIKD